MLTGDNGILNRAAEAKKNTETASTKEQIQIEVLGSYGTDGKLDMNTLKTNLEKIGATVNGENPLTVTLNGQTFTVDSDDLKDVYESSEVNAEKVKKNAKSFYGSKVTGYTCKGTGVDTWRIFYADKDNIYLIADDYILINDAPKGKEGTALYKYSDYRLSLDNVYNDYSGSDWILENSKAKKWLNKYFEYKNEYGNTPNKTSENKNIRAVAFMMDTSDSVWGKWANADFAEYAIGGPTLEMYVESYKDSHPESSISCDVTGTNGYTYSNASGLEASDENKEIYIKTSQENALAMWLASPSSDDNNYIVLAYCDGNLYYDDYHDNHQGLRPLVCLRSNVQLEKVKDGEYKIK
ncbi:MAG: hypothetical protein ILA02_00710 [Clostridia bacterium]|nr:hypothetical protein [Clostridia bacterium]